MDIALRCKGEMGLKDITQDGISTSNGQGCAPTCVAFISFCVFATRAPVGANKDNWQNAKNALPFVDCFCEICDF